MYLRQIFLILIFSCELHSQPYDIVIQKNNIIYSRIPCTTYELPITHQISDAESNPSSFNWILKFTAGNKVFKDISFANPQVGYIVTELGAVYKSTNGGDNWVSVITSDFLTTGMASMLYHPTPS